MELIGRYQNGNYTVSIYDDGTKVRENDLDFFDPKFPESMDIKITNSCNIGCPFCHENSVPGGKHGDILNLPFIDSIHPHTELAIGGGNPLEHPSLIPFLNELKVRNIIANITVNQKHFLEYIPIITELSSNNMIHGVGVSLRPGANDDELKLLISALQSIPNSVIHVINGVHSVDDFLNIAFYDLKVLILGYKDFRRGASMYTGGKDEIERKKLTLYKALPIMIENKWFSGISFDNLAIGQLNVRRLMSPEQWSLFYMGDDGRDGAFTSASMYIDAVNMEFAKNSCSEDRYPVTQDITAMFQFLKNNSMKEKK